MRTPHASRKGAEVEEEEAGGASRRNRELGAVNLRTGFADFQATAESSQGDSELVIMQLVNLDCREKRRSARIIGTARRFPRHDGHPGGVLERGPDPAIAAAQRLTVLRAGELCPLAQRGRESHDGIGLYSGALVIMGGAWRCTSKARCENEREEENRQIAFCHGRHLFPRAYAPPGPRDCHLVR